MNTFEALQHWYQKQCDGHWEHRYGVTIQSLDNPGWLLTVDLVDTPLQDTPFGNLTEYAEDSQNWVDCRRKGNVFHGACGPLQLERVVRIFLDWADRSVPVI